MSPLASGSHQLAPGKNVLREISAASTSQPFVDLLSAYSGNSLSEMRDYSGLLGYRRWRE